ncbi:MAG: polyprenyl synthetase family protein [Pseudomonadota bacterium]
MSLQEKFEGYRLRVDNVLETKLPSVQQEPCRLHESMRYSIFAGGKRVRPALVYLCGELVGARLQDLDGCAAAVEMIHTYSLIHDDLPAMDDDELRRGKPTNHVAFDEATAILAGDALQTLAFETLASHSLSPDIEMNRAQMIRLLAKASGSLGMGGGQAMDLDFTGKTPHPDKVIQMHRMKTGELICCSLLLGAMNQPKVKPEEIQKLTQYGKAIGLAFQIRDDILDIEGDSADIGKPVGSDVDKDKSTFPAVFGMEKAKNLARDWVEQGLTAVAKLPYNTQLLEEFAYYLIDRNH